MFKTRFNTLLMLLALGFLALPAVAQDEEKKQAEPTEESIAALAESAGEMAKAKSDTDMVFFAKQIVERFKGGDEKTQDKAIDAMARGLKTKSDDTKKVIVEQLGKTGHRAAKHLLAEAKKSKKDTSMLCDCLKAAGNVHDPKQWKEILGYINHKDNIVISSAIVSVSGYADEDTKIRKDIVKELLKTYNSVASAANKSNPATTDKEKYNFLFNPFESTLKQLTKKSDIQGAFQWDQWFRKEGEDMKEW